MWGECTLACVRGITPVDSYSAMCTDLILEEYTHFLCRAAVYYCILCSKLPYNVFPG